METFGGDASIDITVTGGDGSYVFDWDTDGTGDFDDAEDLTDLTAGIYHVIVDDETECENIEAVIVVGSQVGIEVSEDAQVRVFPNPATDYFEIEMDGDFILIIYNSLGELVMVQAGQSKTVVPCADWVKGLYSVVLSSVLGTSTKKLIIL